MQESEENFIKHFICSILPAVSMGTSGAAARAVTGLSWIQRDYDSSGSAQGGLERTFVGLWMPLDGPHFCLEGSGFKSILGCSGIFVHEGASASSVLHLTFWKFLSPSFSTQIYLRKTKSNPRSQAWCIHLYSQHLGSQAGGSRVQG